MNETNINLRNSDGLKNIWRKKGKDFPNQHFVHVKFAGRSDIFWECFSHSGVGNSFLIMERTKLSLSFSNFKQNVGTQGSIELI